MKRRIDFSGIGLIAFLCGCGNTMHQENKNDNFGSVNIEEMANEQNLLPGDYSGELYCSQELSYGGNLGEVPERYTEVTINEEGLPDIAGEIIREGETYFLNINGIDISERVISVSRIPEESELSQYSRNLYVYSEVEGNYLGMPITGISERFYAISDSETEELNGDEKRLLVGVRAIFDLPSIGKNISFYSLDCNGTLTRN